MKLSIILIFLTIGIHSLAQENIQVTFSEHPEWNFNVERKVEKLSEPSAYPMPERLFVLSDIEGEFTGLRSILIANKVINEKYNWVFGKGHLVICGDLFDRGEKVNEVLWLLYKLEQDARESGGYVHVILGNHDIMNLSGDLRYVSPKLIAEANSTDYIRQYSKDTELGKWLRSKNIIERIGDGLYCHAGVAPQINKLGMTLKEINEKCRPYYDKARSIKEINDDNLSAFFAGTTSPFWYRGYFHEPKATEAEVNETLRLFGVKRIIVGHTIVPGNIGFYYGGKVLGLDVDQHAGDHQAALFEKGKWWKVNDKGMKMELKNGQIN